MEDGLRCLLKELTKSSKQYMQRFLLIKEKEKNETETERSSFLHWRAGWWPVALVHRAVADPAAQHHAEDHLEDHNNCNHQSGDTDQVDLL